MKTFFLSSILTLSCANVAATELKLIFAGDIMLAEGPGRTIAKGKDPFQFFAPYLAQADYRIGNLETPVATSGKALENKIFAFRAHPRVLPVLKRHFDSVSVANNHSGDYGKTAFVETLQHLDNNKIAYFGGGHHLNAAHRPLWLERQGIKIAVLGYNEFKPRSFEAGANWPGIAWSEDEHVIIDIRAAKAAGADVIIPYMHWGWERELQPTARQRQLTQRMIDEGASVVIGGHPHVTQGAEYYRGKLIVYSLGNFVFDGFDPPEPAATRQGWVLQVNINQQGMTRWHTWLARQDRHGTPHPDLQTATPCGQAGDTQPRRCRGEVAVD